MLQDHQTLTALTVTAVLYYNQKVNVILFPSSVQNPKHEGYHMSTLCNAKCVFCECPVVYRYVYFLVIIRKRYICTVLKCSTVFCTQESSFLAVQQVQEGSVDILKQLDDLHESDEEKSRIIRSA